MTNSDSAYKSFLNKHRDTLACLALVLTTLCVYWQIQNFNFVFFDDPEYVYNNRQIQAGLTLEGIIWAFTTTHSSNWHPLTWLSHMLDCQLFGMNPGRHHLTNLLFHIANILLLFFVFRKMTGDLWQSSFVAALFALHPLHVESVAWVAERKDVLSTFFWLLTMWGYARYVERPYVSRYLIVILFFVLGLMAKPMLVTLPFVLLLLDYWPLKRFRLGGSGTISDLQQGRTIRRLIWEKMPLFLLTAVSSVVTFLVQESGGAVGSFVQYPLAVRIANTLVSYVKYIGKMVYPSKLAVLYPHPGILSWWKITGACLLLVAISFLAIRFVKQRPYFAVGWLWYLGTLVPVIGLVQVGRQSMADRYTYVPLIGIFIIIAWGVPKLMAKWRYRNICLAILATFVLTILTAITWTQAGYWKNSLTLFSHTLEITSKNYVVHNNLGHVLIKTGRIDQGIAHCREALRINPNYSDAHGTWGNGLFAQGKLDEAIIHYSEALRLNPMNEKTYNNLGVALYKKGKINEAISHFKKALQLKPGYIMAKKNLINALIKKRNK